MHFHESARVCELFFGMRQKFRLIVQLLFGMLTSCYLFLYLIRSLHKTGLLPKSGFLEVCLH